MKKVIIGLLVVILMITMTSCGNTLEKRFGATKAKEVVMGILNEIPKQQAIIYVRAEKPVLYQYNKDGDCLATLDGNSVYIVNGGKLITYDMEQEKPVITNQVDVLTLMRNLIEFKESKTIMVKDDDSYKTKTSIVSRKTILDFYQQKLPELLDPMTHYLTDNFNTDYDETMAMELYLYQNIKDPTKMMASLEFVSNQPNKETGDILTNRMVTGQQSYIAPDNFYVNWYFEGISKGVDFSLKALYDKKEEDTDWFDVLTAISKDINDKMIQRMADKEGYSKEWIKAQRINLEEFVKASVDDQKGYLKLFLEHTETILSSLRDSGVDDIILFKIQDDAYIDLISLYEKNKDNQKYLNVLNTKTASAIYLDFILQRANSYRTELTDIAGENETETGVSEEDTGVVDRKPEDIPNVNPKDVEPEPVG